MPIAQLEEVLLSFPALPVDTKQHVFGPRDVITPTTDSLWRIERGIVSTWTLGEDGKLIALGYWGLGDIVGQPLSRLNPYRCQCLTTVEVSLLPPTLLYQELNALIGQFQQTEKLLSILHLHPVKKRLWHFLVWQSPKGKVVTLTFLRLIELPLTHQEMADALATTRVSVTRLLQFFEAQGKLCRQSKRLIITSSAASSTYLRSD